jgi:hypothetical protein
MSKRIRINGIKKTMLKTRREMGMAKKDFLLKLPFSLRIENKIRNMAPVINRIAPNNARAITIMMITTNPNASPKFNTSFQKSYIK